MQNKTEDIIANIADLYNEYIYYAANENIDGFMEKILERMG